ncbi:MAG: hypothetical protein ABF258_10120 [Flavobacteriales bacterium]
MKTLKFISCILLLVLTTVTCKKEKKTNSSFNLYNSRILGTWHLYETIDSDGSVYTLADEENLSFYFDRDGTGKEVQIYPGTNDTLFFYWKFIQYERIVQVVEKNSLDTVEGNISKLTENQLWFSDPDGYQVHYEKK